MEGVVTGSALASVSEKLLAHELGTTAHVSPLLMEAKRRGLRLPDDLEKLAILRGCRYYDGRNEIEQLRQVSRLKIPEDDFSNEELAVALLSPRFETSLWRRRVGAAMLSALGIVPERLADLAKEEGCGALVRYIAECGHEVEPDHVFWKRLLELLADCTDPVENPPHPTRFFEMTGITRGKVGIQKAWVRPRFRHSRT